ncbi:hypothetical protein LTR78_002884 [Recurvomyces mirabilis]|uniref:Uncharacterized protein n=1 Tax=Recurvomyces mirabilis TaxID=574656 RepID=A0AAE1C424_9PEZI|nr:hypothetical protein LTR78_002884 [Recurvomyces mirabilis]KAK5159382.1 hypothetical protein LTS14_002524 [Recurvomyces mirabilis]
MNILALGSQDPMLSGICHTSLDEDHNMANNFFPDLRDEPFTPTDPLFVSFGSVATNATLDSQPWSCGPSDVDSGDMATAWPDHNLFETQPLFRGAQDMFGSPTPYYERAVSPGPIVRIQPEDIPAEVAELAAHINALPKMRGGDIGANEFPYRQTLKTAPLLRGQVSKKTGCLFIEQRGGKLRKWLFDERLFTRELWLYLTDPDYMRVRGGVGRGRKRKTSADGEFDFIAVVPPSPSSTPSTTPSKKKRRGSTAIKSIKDTSVEGESQDTANNTHVLAPCDATESPSTKYSATVSINEDDQAFTADGSITEDLSSALANKSTTECAIEMSPSSFDPTDLMSMLTEDLEDV